ncbi:MULTISPECIES: c-type cytochrome [unclassified Campylobacter]|uniref:c-type cytochrome n=1 Tax=unclassified Campylobacter TaxID=2593542 RepID=UPI001473610E|nr:MULTISPECIES: c-type cytochrome [unclassified Campylobacter]
MKSLYIFITICILHSSLYAIDGKEIYKKCMGCHGQKADLKYHPKASAIVNIPKERRLKALEGYKDGTINRYGMGSSMKDQVVNLSIEELIAVNEFIDTLK